MYEKVNKRPQDEINEILFENHVSEAWLSKRLNMSPQALSYHLHIAKRFDTALQKRIYNVLKKHGYVKSHSNVNLAKSALEFTGKVGIQLASFANNVAAQIERGDLDRNGRDRLRFQVEDMEENLLAQLNELKELLQ